jgi:hypothetical protein
VLADSGVENVNTQVDALITTGVLRRVLAFTELQFSNSMIEAWWRSLKHQWLFLHSLDSLGTVRRLVAFYGAVCTDILHFPARVVVTAADVFGRWTPVMFEGSIVALRNDKSFDAVRCQGRDRSDAVGDFRLQDHVEGQEVARKLIRKCGR